MQQEEEKSKQEEEEKSKSVWRPTGRFGASAAAAPVQKNEETNGKYVPPQTKGPTSAGKYVPRKDIVSPAPFSASDPKLRGKYAPPREVVAAAPYSAITKPKDTTSEETKPREKWVPPQLRKK